MIETNKFFDTLNSCDVNFFAGVPDSLLKHLCAYISDRVPSGQHVIAANEGSAVALATGHYLSTGTPALVYMQNSGQGNAVNPLVSLADPEVYGIPMLLLVGWRGEPGLKDEPQHAKQGKITDEIFRAMDIPCSILPNETDPAIVTVKNAIHQCRQETRPVALLVHADSFSTSTSKYDEPDGALNREQVISQIAGFLPPDAALISTTGHISRELYEFRLRSQSGHAHDFLTVGSMGHASQIALGIALNQPQRPVVCFDGDGAALMHLGALPIIGSYAGPHFLHILLNNGAHGSVGGQPTVGFNVNFPDMARACGYRMAMCVTRFEEIAASLTRLLKTDGPTFLEICVSIEARADLGRPQTSPRENKTKFMEFLQT